MELWSSRKSEFLILLGRIHPIRSRGLRIGAPFGWIDFRAIHNNGQCFKCARLRAIVYLRVLVVVRHGDLAVLQEGRADGKSGLCRIFVK